MNSARRTTELPLIPIKAAPLRPAAPGHARTGLRPWGADPVRRAGQPRQHPPDPAGLTAWPRPEARPETHAANLRKEIRHLTEPCQILPALPPPESVHPTLRASAFAWALRAADPTS